MMNDKWKSTLTEIAEMSQRARIWRIVVMCVALKVLVVKKLMTKILT